MTSRKELERRRYKISEQVGGVQGASLIVALVVGPLLFTLPLIFVSEAYPWLGDPGVWFEEGARWYHRTLGVIWIILLLVFGVGGSLWAGYAIPEWWWKRYYRKAWQALKETQLGLLVLNDAGLEPIYELTDKYPWLRWSMAGRPLSLEDHIEFASDYWRCLLALAEGRHERLARGVIWGNLVRRLDDAYPWIFGNCIGPMLLLMLAPLFVITVPAWVLLSALFIQQQAFQAAFYDFFSTGRQNLSIETND